MSLTPAYDAQKLQQIKDAAELCGKNRGPHDFIPIEWWHDHETNIKRVTRLICRICFANISMECLMKHYPDVSY